MQENGSLLSCLVFEGKIHWDQNFIRTGNLSKNKGTMGRSQVPSHRFIDSLGTVTPSAPKLVMKQKHVYLSKAKGTPILLKVEESRARRRESNLGLLVTCTTSRERIKTREVLNVRESKPCCSPYQA